MDVLQGKVRELKVTELVAGQYGEQIVYRSAFLLDGTHNVRVQTHHRPRLREGDLVVVSGTPRSFGLNALAYANLTTGEQDNVGKWQSLFGGIALVVVSGWWATGHVAFLAAAAGLWCIVTSARIALASYDVRLSALSSDRPAAERASASAGDA